MTLLLSCRETCFNDFVASFWTRIICIWQLPLFCLVQRVFLFFEWRLNEFLWWCWTDRIVRFIERRFVLSYPSIAWFCSSLQRIDALIKTCYWWNTITLWLLIVLFRSRHLPIAWSTALHVAAWWRFVIGEWTQLLWAIISISAGETRICWSL